VWSERKAYESANEIERVGNQLCEELFNDFLTKGEDLDEDVEGFFKEQLRKISLFREESAQQFRDFFQKL
jgi:hypothetical protein